MASLRCFVRPLYGSALVDLVPTKVIENLDDGKVFWEMQQLEKGLND